MNALQHRVPVLIAGGSFAGLAAARILGSHALVVDRAPLGDGQTSACGAPVAIIDRMGAAGSIMQRHDHLVIAVGDRSVTWPLPEPFCTFDYREFCRLAFAGSGATFVQASVQGVDGTRVRTSIGEIEAKIVVDAMGPRSVLARGVRGRRLAFGLETEIRAPARDGLHFYFLPEVRDGYAWAFPCGSVTRFGVLSYLGKSDLLPALRRFVSRFDLRIGALHGGFLATGLAPQTEGNMFVAGDASGQCLPLTGEGIRTAVLAGEECGRLIKGTVERRWSLEEARQQYRTFIVTHYRAYRSLLWANAFELLFPRPLLPALMRVVTLGPLLHRFLSRYLAIFHTKGSSEILGSVLKGT